MICMTDSTHSTRLTRLTSKLTLTHHYYRYVVRVCSSSSHAHRIPATCIPFWAGVWRSSLPYLLSSGCSNWPSKKEKNFAMRVLGFGVALVSCYTSLRCAALSSSPSSANNFSVLGRRGLFSKSAAASLAIGTSSFLSTSTSAVASIDAGAPPATFYSYRILPDASPSLSPGLDPVLPDDLTRKMALLGNDTGGSAALFLGEHHNSAADHQLQAEFIRNIYAIRNAHFGRNAPPMSIGLEQVQRQFQPVLDDYVAGKISAEEMKRRVEWDKRWSWSFEGYLPCFETARKLRIPLVALNVDSEDLGLVEVGGFPNLPKSQIQKYIKDPQGFADFARKRSYKTYVDYVISPSYDMHRDLGILKTTITGQRLDEDMSFDRFFSGRILWDEGMAAAAHTWTETNNQGLMLALIGADHVKFEDGVVGRFKRMAKGNQDCASVILNPSLIDTRPSGSINMATNNAFSGADQITLQLRYLKEGIDPASSDRRLPENTGGVLALADYIVMSNKS